MSDALKLYSNRSQGLIMVMKAVSLLGGSNTEQMVREFIDAADYYRADRHDLPPYPGLDAGKYYVLMAWARKDCVDRGLVRERGEDAWELSLSGRWRMRKIRRWCESGRLDPRQCYLWTPKFKGLMDPEYKYSSKDARGPEDVIDQVTDLEL